ncbi:MAG: inositol monophosphatase [Neisseria sp.]|jgi:myo-inositol-1(or 4)-monophosphatase|uniref:inositol monophosphatase family protein n=1 Tax=Uruburuella suis TaxID=252130 RepID=UPI001B57FEE8|nr:inositol monophosphatase family protein [Uruburuella suis]MBP6393851.1 inositol monophosphatase [Neisseria sp.]MBP7259178.1 inositol monophosphatase [Neisseria sp.]MBP8025274.1 inositol monophosphatase [Neisseria sp.]MBP8043600.1 inositol monophosphatase [Neisseria sp.]MBP8045951.1 inositol monophosphatase [Neisseria sp.]
MNPILNTAFKAARKAGDMMIRASANLDAVKVDSKAFNDFVSDIDRQSESILLDTLFYSYPTHLVRSEEGGYFRASKTREGVTIEQMDAADVPAVPEYEWIIDPLDGTTNYLHGHPQYAISMALLHKGKLQEALVYAPERNDCYMASRGQGALRNDRRIRVSNRIELNRCLIGTGFPVVDQSMMDTYLAILKDFLAKTAGGRREGAAALDLCALACGRLDGFFEFNLKPWDIAAGALIVQEAGGIVTDMQGNESWLESGDVVAANPKVLAQMLQIIAPHIK